MTSRGKFLGGHWGARQNFGGAVPPPGTPLAPPLNRSLKSSLKNPGCLRRIYTRGTEVDPAKSSNHHIASCSLKFGKVDLLQRKSVFFIEKSLIALILFSIPYIAQVRLEISIENSRTMKIALKVSELLRKCSRVGYVSDSEIRKYSLCYFLLTTKRRYSEANLCVTDEKYNSVQWCAREQIPLAHQYNLIRGSDCRFEFFCQDSDITMVNRVCQCQAMHHTDCHCFYLHPGFPEPNRKSWSANAVDLPNNPAKSCGHCPAADAKDLCERCDWFTAPTSVRGLQLTDLLSRDLRTRSGCSAAFAFALNKGSANTTQTCIHYCTCAGTSAEHDVVLG